MIDNLELVTVTFCEIIARLIADLEGGQAISRKDFARRLRAGADSSTDERQANIFRLLADHLDPPPRWTPSVIDGGS